MKIGIDMTQRVSVDLVPNTENSNFCKILMAWNLPNSKCSLIYPFFVILILHSLAVYLFTRGFLLTRTELSSFSNCSDPYPCPFVFEFKPNNRCWTRPSVDRLVIIVLDALRFDFVAPSTFFEEKKKWMDKLTVLQRLAKDESVAARIFKAIADPPTTSLQRLKGLTTGGLPTFIDIGNSFGAPAIAEDNLLYQLATNGKRVLMMGDDTWVQLFPEHFAESYPYPSFNVKDLDTVDNGCTEHLLPSLYKDDWDVLIAHFLGVDHAGHIFGVDSTQMIQKLEQYNNILEEIVEVLKNQSGSGGLHENTLLLVMGDHGQTLNGDHGGGTAEEVETSLFAMSMKSHPPFMSSVFEANNCKLDLDGDKICTGTFEQLDFAATVSALLGVPFPFGSIGRVNPELYALSAGTLHVKKSDAENCSSESNLEAWMQNYINALCINSWQVKRYIDNYSQTSVIGLPTEDLLHLTELYNRAQANWSNTVTCLNQDRSLPLSTLQKQIDVYSHFLESVAQLARSAWTEFDLVLMGIGIALMIASLFVHLFAIRRLYTVCGLDDPLRLLSSCLLVLMRGASFLSNSFILAEGRVACFLLGTTGIINLLHAISSGKSAAEEIGLVCVNIILGFGIRSGIFGVLKQNAESSSFSTSFLSMLASDNNTNNSVWIGLAEMLPVILLLLGLLLVYTYSAYITGWGYLKFLSIATTLISYVLMAVHMVSESSIMEMSETIRVMGRYTAPRLVYGVGFGSVVLLTILRIFYKKKTCQYSCEMLRTLTVIMISAWSSTIILLLGRQGPFVALICSIGAWCIVKTQHISSKSVGESFTDPISITQWSLLGVCLFYYSGHWCTFDGLRYGAAFVGFENFNIVRQGILLSIDTFGVSHILPVLGLPFLVNLRHRKYQEEQEKYHSLFLNLSQVFLSYGLITAVTTTFTIVCVTIQRRHLMVWGLFAPKYVFDVLGLLLTDVLICFASLIYY